MLKFLASLIMAGALMGFPGLAAAQDDDDVYIATDGDAAVISDGDTHIITDGDTAIIMDNEGNAVVVE